MVSNKATSDIVGKLWSLCNILKDDGVTFHQYVIELTYLLFLKMADETGSDAHIPKNCSWKELVAKPAPIRLTHYKLLLATMANSGSKQIKEIFSNASTFIKKANTLSVLVTEIDKLEWYSVHREDLGDLYEGLLEKNASEKKSGAGQYFTPRVLIDSMVAVMKPNLSDVIQDPAAGTGDF
nr:N-6 DNA methylase [Pseudomonas congelans]